jgi:hypothetical protein
MLVALKGMSSTWMQQNGRSDPSTINATITMQHATTKQHFSEKQLDLLRPTSDFRADDRYSFVDDV